MAGGGIDPKTYDALVDWFRRYRGDVHGAARHAGVDWRTAGRWFDGRKPAGPPKVKPEWLKFPTIKELLDFEDRKAIEAEVEAKKLAADLTTRERDQRIAALKVADEILDGARTNTLNGTIVLARMTDGIANLADCFNEWFKQIKPGTKGDELPMSPTEFYLMLQRWASTARHLIATAEAIIQIERLRAGLPTAIVSIQSITIDEAVKAHERAGQAIKRMEKLGIIPGGKAA